MASRRIDSGLFRLTSGLVQNYLDKDGSISPLVNDFFSLKNTLESASVRDFSSERRSLLHEAISGQYKMVGIEADSLLQKQLDQLLDPNTFTVTTGHQLCLFTGPLYFIIKILHTIKLADDLNDLSADKNFIPVFWLASEDHDFAEINHAHVFQHTLRWDDDQQGAVGRFGTDKLSRVMAEFKGIIGDSPNAEELYEVFSRAYLSGKNLSAATRYIVHELFGNKGLLILDGDEVGLKKEFVPYMLREVGEGILFRKQEETIKNHFSEYKIQVNPREINLFYLSNNGRNLIEREGDHFGLKEGQKKWKREELFSEIRDFPERFSPNVVFRPLYQEIILPNLVYVGGGAEIAYWLQLKSAFEEFGVPFPLLNLRNSVMWLEGSKIKKLEKLGLTEDDLFAEEAEITRKLADFEELDDVLDGDIQAVHSAFETMSARISDMDASLKPYVLAEGKKVENQLEQMKARLLKARKSKNEERVNSYWNLHEKVFPGGNLHERYDNFVPYFLRYGKDFFDRIYAELNPEDHRLILITD